MENIIFKNELVYVVLEKDVAILYINNGKQNYISNPEFVKVSELEELFKIYDIKALVIKGKEKNFSMGADVNKFDDYKNNINEFKNSLNKGKELLSYIENLPIVTIAILTGACFGAGFEIALSCQFRFANERTLISFPEINIGLMPGMGGTVRLTRLVGRVKALEMILSGEMIGAQDAFELKIIDKIIPRKQELKYTLEWIESLFNQKVTDQILKIVTAVNNACIMDEKRAYELETDAFSALINLRD